MKIKFKQGAAHLGYAYRKGSVAASLPLDKAKYLVEIGIAEEIPEEKAEPKRAKPKTTQVKKAKVKTADIKK